MNLAIVQLRRAPGRSVALTGVVAILLFLVEYLAAVSSSLQALNTGALEHLHADLVVYSRSADGSLDASRLPAGAVAMAGRVPGVAAAEPLGVADFTVAGPRGRYELALIGLGGGQPGWPSPVTGRLPGPGGVLADTTETGAGLAPGQRIALEPGGTALRVTGSAAGIRYDALVTAWSTYGTWMRAVQAANPGGAVAAHRPAGKGAAAARSAARGAGVAGTGVRTAGSGSSPPASVVQPNGIVIRGRPGVALPELAARLGAALPGAVVLTRAAAVADVPGAGILSVTFGLLIGIAFVAAVLVISSVFLLVTVQRWRIWALLRGLGASAGRLAAAVLLQAVLVVLAASVLASAALAVVASASGPAVPLRAGPGLLTATVAAALAGALVSGLLPVRRIGRLDPATAMRA